MSDATDPAWPDNSERTTATINGQLREVIDHYGTITQIPFPGVPSTPGGQLPFLDIDVSRTDVIDDHDETVVRPGPYLLSIAAVASRELSAESTLTAVADLEQFAAAILTAAQQVRAFLADDSDPTQPQEADPS